MEGPDALCSLTDYMSCIHDVVSNQTPMSDYMPVIGVESCFSRVSPTKEAANKDAVPAQVPGSVCHRLLFYGKRLRIGAVSLIFNTCIHKPQTALGTARCII